MRASPATAALAALLLTLALLTVYLPTATANHHSCTWVGPGDNPTNAGWWFWCTATKKNEEPGKADYICSAGGQKVADYGGFATVSSSDQACKEYQNLTLLSREFSNLLRPVMAEALLQSLSATNLRIGASASAMRTTTRTTQEAAGI